jgi:hypothetical protein
LASVYSLAYDAAQRQVLGSDVAIDITAIDETNSRVRVKDIIAQLKRHDGFGMVGLVGARSNQFPRTLDLARPFRQAGIPVVIEHLIRQHAKNGFNWFFITDDNFARNKDWEPIFDRLILLRERDGLDIKLLIQVDTLCHKIPNFIEKSARAGVKQVFIGLENINPANLMAAKKRQNKITEYRKMILAWKQARVITYAGYILGFPADTPESIREDIEIIKKELPLDILEFFCLTPLPGSEDHKTRSGRRASGWTPT